MTDYKTESDADFRADLDAALLEASGDDHFYGAWRGGSKASGGGPASEKGKGTDAQRRKDMANRVGADKVGQPTSLTAKLKAKAGQKKRELSRRMGSKGQQMRGADDTPDRNPRQVRSRTPKINTTTSAKHKGAQLANERARSISRRSAAQQRRRTNEKRTKALDQMRDRDERRVGQSAKDMAAKYVKRKGWKDPNGTEAFRYIQNRWEAQRRSYQRDGKSPEFIARARKNFADGANIAAANLD